MTSRVTFWGGAGAVTGANFMLETGDSPDSLPFEGRSGPSGPVEGGTGKKIIVDCGILQREHVCDEHNYGPFPYDAKSVDILVVTHAHADHIGRVPKLVRDGFRGTIYSTAPTKDLSVLMFGDALRIMRDSVETKQCGMLYEAHDVEQALKLWKTISYHEPTSLGDSILLTFLNAGHILGSAMAQFSRSGKKILFTGDLGNSPEPLLPDTESAEGTDFILMESVYGDRVHENREGRREALRLAIEAARTREGVLLVPSFSIERTQILLSEIGSMIQEGVMQPIAVYLDSPLATKVTETYRKYTTFLNDAVQTRFMRGNDPFTFKGLAVIRSVGESRAIHETSNPKVIIAGSGMSSGGRIREHEKRYLSDQNATILFVGYQAPGSLGRRLQDGESKVVIDGQIVRVRARVAALSGYSGHKDRDGLLSFAESAGPTLKRVFVAMGETKASYFLAQRLRDFLGLDAIVPDAGQSFDIAW